jgi:hypothetical protein
MITAGASTTNAVTTVGRTPIPLASSSPFGSHSLDRCSKIVGRTGFEPVTSSVSGCRRSRLSGSLAAVTWAYVCWAPFGLPSVSCAYPRDPLRSRAVVGPSLGDVHGSEGRLCNRANYTICLHGFDRSCCGRLRSFRVYSGSWKLPGNRLDRAGDGPRPVSGRLGLALVWPVCGRRLDANHWRVPGRSGSAGGRVRPRSREPPLGR